MNSGNLPAETRGLFASTIFTTRPDAPCRDCGGYHLRACPRIKRIQFVPSGSTAGERAEVEYWPPGTWEDSEIIWPEDVYEND